MLEKRDVKRPGYIFVADIDPSGPLEHKVTRLFEGSAYMFRVMAENQVGVSESCETENNIIAKPPYGKKRVTNIACYSLRFTDEPGSPRDLRVTEYWTDYISLAWEAPESDGGTPITGYIIEKRDASRPSWIKAGTVDANTLTFKAGNLFEGAEYCFRVYAENKAGPCAKPVELSQPCKAKMPFG